MARARHCQRLNSTAANSATLSASSGGRPSSRLNAADRPAHATRPTPTAGAVPDARHPPPLVTGEPSGPAGLPFHGRDYRDVGVIEAPFPDEAFRIDGRPSARAEVEHIAVVHVAMQNHNVTLARRQVRCSGGSDMKDSPVRLSRTPESFKPLREPDAVQGRPTSRCMEFCQTRAIARLASSSPRLRATSASDASSRRAP